MQSTLPTAGSHRKQAGQRGASLIIVLIVLTIVSLLGVAGIQVSMMSERGARNDRDMQLAWQSAESALIDAELELFVVPTVGSASTRQDILFDSLGKEKPKSLSYVDGCGTGTQVGLCNPIATGKPVWLTVPFTLTGSAAQSASYGQFTGRTFAAGTLGIQPAAVPRYIVELINVPGLGNRDQGNLESIPLYRVTAMGFGPRTDVQAVVQMIYRN